MLEFTALPGPRARRVKSDPITSARQVTSQNNVVSGDYEIRVLRNHDVFVKSQDAVAPGLRSERKSQRLRPKYTLEIVEHGECVATQENGCDQLLPLFVLNVARCRPQYSI